MLAATVLISTYLGLPGSGAINRVVVLPENSKIVKVFLPSMTHFVAKPYEGDATQLEVTDSFADPFFAEHVRLRNAMRQATGEDFDVPRPSRIKAKLESSYDTKLVYKRIEFVMIEAVRSELLGKWVALKPTVLQCSELCYPWSAPGTVSYAGLQCADEITSRDQLSNPDEVDRFFGVKDFAKYSPVESPSPLIVSESSIPRWYRTVQQVTDLALTIQLPLKAAES